MHNAVWWLGDVPRPLAKVSQDWVIMKNNPVLWALLAVKAPKIGQELGRAWLNRHDNMNRLKGYKMKTWIMTFNKPAAFYTLVQSRVVEMGYRFRRTWCHCNSEPVLRNAYSSIFVLPCLALDKSIHLGTTLLRLPNCELQELWPISLMNRVPSLEFDKSVCPSGNLRARCSWQRAQLLA